MSEPNMTDDLEQRARTCIQQMKDAVSILDDLPDRGWVSIKEAELLSALLAFARQERQVLWEENMKMACRLCRQGYPLQENGSWHNDKLGRDSMVNNACLAVGIRDQANGEKNVASTNT